MKTSYLFKAMLLTSAVGLTACDGDKKTIIVEPNQAPAAVISTSQSVNNVTVDTDITFDGSSSIDSDGDIAKWIWDGVEGTDKTYTTQFDSQGSKSVSLVVVDDKGAKSSPYLLSVNVGDSKAIGDVNNSQVGVFAKETSVSITSSEASLELGQQTQLSANVSWDNDSITNKVAWSVSSSSIATIDPNTGLLSSKAVGKVVVTAKSGEQSATKELTITPAEKVAASLKSTPTNLAFDAIGKTAEITLVATYKDGTTADSPAISWICSPSSVLEISGNTLKALAEGSTECTATWLEQEAVINVAVTLAKITVSGVSVSPSAVTLEKGGSQHLSALVSYSAGADKTDPEGITWECADTTIATISASGLVEEVKEGETVCTATIDSKVNTATITVKYAVEPNGADDVTTISINPNTVSIEKDASEQLRALVTYSDDSTETNPDFVQWSCEGSNVSITDSGMLTGLVKSTGNMCTALVTGQTGKLVPVDCGVGTDCVQAATVTVAVTEESTGEITPVNVDRLGAVYTKASTRFAIWAPDSSSVKVKINNADGSAFGDGTYDLKKEKFAEYENEVFVLNVADVPLYAQYKFLLNDQPVRDPYGTMVVPNETDASKEYNIVMARTHKGPQGKEWAPVADNGYYKEREDAVIYEIHIRDLTMDENSGVDDNLKGTFSGFVQANTSHPDDNSIKTGIEHLKELGVTHVQILPMYDFATCSQKAGPENRTQIYPSANLDWETDCFNWGYDPENFNIPEEYYASVDKDNYQGRVDEVKYFVDELHKAGIRVVMDVVYNHTYMWIDGVTSNMDGGGWETTSPRISCGDGDCPIEDDFVHETVFNPISKQYFTPKGLSGTGNSLSVEPGTPMVSRFIQDSMEFWINEYNIDGFRFDLVGIFDHSEFGRWGNYLNAKFPEKTLLIYGEPWNGYKTDPREGMRVRYDTIGQQVNNNVGVFNGIFREAIKGSNDDGRKGYVNDANASKDSNGQTIMAKTNIINGMRGSLGNGGGWDLSTFTKDPEQTINYVSAHDNLTMADKLYKSAGSDENYNKQLSMYSNGVVLTAQGIPFLHAGSELFRRKDDRFGSSHNSYRSPGLVNNLKWDWKRDYKDVFDYYKNMIAIRKAQPNLRLNTEQEINSNMNVREENGAIVSEITGNPNNGAWTDIKVILNTGNDKQFDASGWKLAVTGQDTSVQGTAVNGSVTAKGSSVTILYKD